MRFLNLKLRWHKLKHWEYWNVYVVYFPSILYWVFYAVKYRNYKLYNYTNPAIKNGGLFDVSKQEIYRLLPKNVYPKTTFIAINQFNKIEEIISLENIVYPVIVKPDKGYRGVGVQIVNNIKEIYTYAATLKQDFLIQEICTYPNEIGLFFCRLPHNNTSNITGITIKKFLTVTGDGVTTIEQLLLKNARYSLQIKRLQEQYDLQQILPKNKNLCLVPFGNHNRGTEFVNGKQYITPELEQYFTNLLSTIEGFNYGRLDIRFNSFTELQEGKNFSIIELNGVMSEPTHIYDKNTSFFNAQKEIFKHQNILKKIVRYNLNNNLSSKN